MMFLLNLFFGPAFGFQTALAANFNRINFDYPNPRNYNYQSYELVQSWGVRISNCGSTEGECQVFSTPLLLKNKEGRYQKAKLFYDCEAVRGPSELGNYECHFLDSPHALFISKESFHHCEITEDFHSLSCAD